MTAQTGLSRQARSESMNSVLDSIESVLGMVSIPDVRNISLSMPKHDVEVEPNIKTDTKVHKRNKASLSETETINSPDEHGLESINSAYLEEMLSFYHDTEAGISRAYLNCLSLEFQMAIYMSDVNDTEFDELYTKSLQDSQMFCEGALLILQEEKLDCKEILKKQSGTKDETNISDDTFFPEKPCFFDKHVGVAIENEDILADEEYDAFVDMVLADVIADIELHNRNKCLEPWNGIVDFAPHAANVSIGTKEAIPDKEYLNYLSPGLQTAIYSPDVNDMDFDDLFAKSLLDSKMFCESALLTQQEEEQDCIKILENQTDTKIDANVKDDDASLPEKPFLIESCVTVTIENEDIISESEYDAFVNMVLADVIADLEFHNRNICIEPVNGIADLESHAPSENIETEEAVPDKESIAVADSSEVDVPAVVNGVADTVVYINNEFDFEASLFGIFSIYKKSDLHCEINKTIAENHVAKTKAIGYKFFSLSTFFR